MSFPNISVAIWKHNKPVWFSHYRLLNWIPAGRARFFPGLISVNWLFGKSPAESEGDTMIKNENDQQMSALALMTVYKHIHT